MKVWGIIAIGNVNILAIIFILKSFVMKELLSIYMKIIVEIF